MNIDFIPYSQENVSIADTNKIVFQDYIPGENVKKRTEKPQGEKHVSQRYGLANSKKRGKKSLSRTK